MKKSFTCLFVILFMLIFFPKTASASGNDASGKNDNSVQEPAVVTGSAITVRKMTVKASTGSADKRIVKVSWKKMKRASTYAVLIKENGGWEVIKNTSETNAAIKLSGNAPKKRYLIRAIDVHENIIGESDVFSLPLPGKLGNLHTTAYSETKLILSWNKVKNVNEYVVKIKEAGGKYKTCVTVKSTRAKLTVAKDKQYKFRVTPVYRSGGIVLKGTATSTAFHNTEIVAINHQHYSYQELCADLKALQKKYSGYLSYQAIGKSEQGRGIYDVVLGNTKAKRALLVVSTLHASEYVSTVVCMDQLEYYLRNYNRVIDGMRLSDLFNKCCVHYIMMANPDGVAISQGGNPLWKGNANGVNLNRNFPQSFCVEGSVARNDYSGKYPASEKETKAVIRLTKKLAKTKKLAVVNYHAMGNIVFGGYEGKDSTLRNKINSMYWIARNTTGYADSAGYSGSSHGNYREYLSYHICVPSITVEVGSVACPVPSGYYPSIYQQNRLVILREAAFLCSW